MRALSLVFLIVTLPGCAMFYSPKEQPVVEDHIQNWLNIEKVGVLSTTAERREVIFKFPDNQFCAEPPPDVAETLASTLTLLAQGSVTNASSEEISARLEVTKALATSIKSLFHRSQGAQFFRDGSFNLCQGYLNGAVRTPEKYVEMYENLLNTSKGLVELEVPFIQAEKAAEITKSIEEAETLVKKSALDAAISAQLAKQAADRAEAAAKAKQAVDRVEEAAAKGK